VWAVAAFARCWRFGWAAHKWRGSDRSWRSGWVVRRLPTLAVAALVRDGAV
jgi:hypothetical protein